MISDYFMGIFLGVFVLTISYLFSLYKLKVSNFSTYDLQKYFPESVKEDQPDFVDESEQGLIVALGVGRTLMNTGFLVMIFWLLNYRFPLLSGHHTLSLLVGGVGAVFLLWLTDIIVPMLVWTRTKSRLSSFAVVFIRVNRFLFSPIVFLTRVLRGKIEEHVTEDVEEDQAEFEEEIRTLIDEGEKKGLFEKYEGSLFQSVVEFNETVVREVMTPRLDIVAIEINELIPALIQRIIDNGYSRIPCYTDRIDNINGIIFAKDLLTHWGKSNEDIVLTGLLREAMFIPETKKITQLLKEFQINKNHMAIVVDEYGGVSGLVTIEDLLEEIVGEIRDEYDNEVDQIQVLEDNSLKVDARVNVEELEEYFNITIPRSDFDTVGGLIFHILGRVPKEGEEIRYEKLVMKILKAEERRVRLIHVTMPGKVDTNDTK